MSASRKIIDGIVNNITHLKMGHNPRYNRLIQNSIIRKNIESVGIKPLPHFPRESVGDCVVYYTISHTKTILINKYTNSTLEIHPKIVSSGGILIWNSCLANPDRIYLLSQGNQHALVNGEFLNDNSLSIIHQQNRMYINELNERNRLCGFKTKINAHIRVRQPVDLSILSSHSYKGTCSRLSNFLYA